MPEYIEREAILKKAIKERRFVFQMEDFLNNEVIFKTVYKDLAECINSIPAADVSPVRHGRWLQKKHKIFGNAYDYVCSECGCDYALAEYNYCPNCGAKTDLEG